MATPANAHEFQHQVQVDFGDSAKARPCVAAACTAFPSATDAAIDILKSGGNAVDAAVAAAWALSVCEPSASGLGGQGTLLLRTADGKCRVIDGHSHAPMATSSELISKRQQQIGHRSSTIPSTVALLGYAQRKYGKLRPQQVLAPAIRLAEEGYAVTRLQHRQTRWVAESLRESPGTSALFMPDGMPPPEGSLFRQHLLATTLRRIANSGFEDFYHGHIASLIAADMRLQGGIITEEDLAACGLPVEREPISIHYRGYQIVTVPPPGGGIQLLLAFLILEQLAPAHFGDVTDEWYETVAQVIHAVFLERERCPISSQDVTPAFLASVLSEERVRKIVANVKAGWSNAPRHAGVEEPGDTTHLCVADGSGNIVSLTQSIQSVFGAKVANPFLGFLYNNYLRTCRRHAHPNELKSRCMPQSNAAPTLVLQETPGGIRPILAVGAAGSRRITSSILQVISGVIDRRLDVKDAVSSPRLHALLSRNVWVERPIASESLAARLQKHFPKLIEKSANHYAMGAVQALEFFPDGTVTGAADPRRDGTAAACLLDDERS